MKKVLSLLIIAAIFVCFLSSVILVSAETNFEIWGRTASGQISTLLESWKLDPANATSVLMGILAWMLIYSLVKESQVLGAHGGIWSGAISLIITLLVMIYVPDSFLMAIATQYAALGGTILTIFPFLLAAYFTTKVSNDLITSKAVWFLFFVYYILMLFFAWGLVDFERVREITFLGGTMSESTLLGIAYFVGAIASVIMFFFIQDFRTMVSDWAVKGKSIAARAKVKKATAATKIRAAEIDDLVSTKTFGDGL